MLLLYPLLFSLVRERSNQKLLHRFIGLPLSQVLHKASLLYDKCYLLLHVIEASGIVEHNREVDHSSLP